MRTLSFPQHPCPLQQQIVCVRQGHLLFSPLQGEGETYPLVRDVPRSLKRWWRPLRFHQCAYPQKTVLAIGAAALEDDPKHLIGCEWEFLLWQACWTGCSITEHRRRLACQQGSLGFLRLTQGCLELRESQKSHFLGKVDYFKSPFIPNWNIIEISKPSLLDSFV